MCGICGILRFDGQKLEPSMITAMTHRLAHRGPDDDGQYLDGPLGLGHRRLSIIDLAHGHQPLSNEDGTVWVVFNGMIYNYQPLIQELTRLGHHFATRCDTEVLVHAYEEWGSGMLPRLNGQFAFAVWDGHRLFLARDRMGEKPLYYAVTQQALFFASEIKSLLVHLRAEPSLPSDFLVFENTLSDDTLFCGIKELPAAHYLMVTSHAVAPQRYWSIPNEVDPYLSEREAVQTLRELIYDSVMLRMQADVPVGMYLSGGLDSSLIACIAHPKYVLTSYYDAPGKFDERALASIVAGRIQAEQIFVTLTPISSSSTISSFNLARNAKPYFKVVLNGQGADELFGGYGRYVLMQHEVELGRVPFFQQYTPMARRFWHRNMFGDPAVRYLELNQRVSPRTTLPTDTVRLLFSHHTDIVAQMGYTDAMLTLQDLIKMDDRGCGHAGLESRSPFLDHRIVEFAFRLPAHYKIRSGGMTKWILREVAREFVPSEILDRTDKMGMVSPIGNWLRRELKEWTDGLVAALNRRRLDLLVEPPEDNEYDRRLHALLSLELWFRCYIDPAGSDGTARGTC
jgi:asparagine synthase (glutamine-hydrolysing)